MSKILLVNDDADINITVRQVLEDKGFKVDSYEDPRLDLENFKPNFYDLVPPPDLLNEVNCFIPKPVDIDDLVKKVKKELNL